MTTRLLLIDSDIDSVVKIKKALEETGEFRVSVSANGVAALEALRRGRHDCAVVGFDIPDMDVMEVLMQLYNVQPGLPVIMTPHTQAHQERLRFLDVQGAINKPYSARDLIPYVRSVINRASRPAARAHTGEDDFVPPEMPAALRHLVEPHPDKATPSPTELLDRIERDKLGDLPEPERVSAAEILAELEAMDRIQTGELAPPPDDLLAALEVKRPAPPGATPPDSAPPGQTHILDDDTLSGGTVQLRWEADQDEDQSDTRPLTMPEEPAQTTAALQWDQASGDTRPLDESQDEPPSTTQLLEWNPPGDTSKLADTKELDDIERARLGQRQETPGSTALLRWDTDETRDLSSTATARGLDATMPLEPPVEPGDTPAVPGPYSGAVDDFDDVLDAVARASFHDAERKQEDQHFDSLLDDMRAETPARAPRTRLEDLLSALAADAAQDVPPGEADNALDFVLDAIRRGATPPPEGDAPDQDTDSAEPDDDTTIGEVIDGLFDPAFEGVLAALAGEDIEESDFDEPTYAREGGTLAGTGPDTRDRISFEEMSADGDSPAWLADYEAEPAPPSARPGPVIPEPPVSAEDSSRYPATAALNAVTQSEDDFSLHKLLDAIEAQLPAVPTGRPQLKPLPSWQKNSTGEEARRLAEVFGAPESSGESRAPRPGSGQKIAAMFDHLEGAAQDEDAAALPTAFEESPPASAGETVTAAELEEWASAPAPLGVDQPDSEPSEEASSWLDDAPLLAEEQDKWNRPTPPPIIPPPVFEEPLTLDGIFDADLTFDETAATEDLEQYQDVLDEQIAAGDLEPLSVRELLAMTHLPAEEDTVDEEDEIDLAARLGPARADGTPAGTFEEHADEAIAAAFYAGVRDAAEQDQGGPEPRGFPGDEDLIPPDDDHLVPVPVEEAARLWETESTPPAPQPDHEDEEADEALAQIAVMLTQYSLESSAQATMLSRPGKRVAASGDLPDAAMARLFEIVDHAWQTGSGDANSLIRYITLPETGEFLLYSILVDDDLALSMVFNANTPVRTIRRQARRLSESLEFVPDEPAPLAEEPSPTQPSRPTALRPPHGLRQDAPADDADAPPIPTEIPSRPPRDESAYTAYGCLWIPADPGLELMGDFAEALEGWIHETAAQSPWRLDFLDIRPDYVSVALRIPDKTAPDAVIGHLMDGTAARAVETFLEVLPPVWADGYFVMSPPRDLSEREIARFITYQRQAQLG